MKVSYSGNYHDFNRLVKQLDDRIMVGNISSPTTTVCDEYDQKLSQQLYHYLTNLYSILHDVESHDIDSAKMGAIKKLLMKCRGRAYFN